jgi:hypothetical protein
MSNSKKDGEGRELPRPYMKRSFMFEIITPDRLYEQK